MWRPHPQTEAFLDALIEASDRYYALVDASGENLPLSELLGGEGLEATWFERERFWRHVRRDGERLWWLHLSAPRGPLELGLYMRSPGGDLGGPVHSLMLETAQRRDRRFSRQPKYPRLPATAEAVRFARWLLEEAVVVVERLD